MKRVLAGQIRKHLWFLKPAELQKMQGFFDAVLEMYESFEQDRKLMERSIELSSEEMMQNNEKLFEQSEELQKSIFWHRKLSTRIRKREWKS